LREGIVHRLQNNAINQTGACIPRIGLAALIASCAFVFGCSATNKPQAEAPPPSTTVAAPQPQQVSQLPPPELNQVQEALKRVFKNSVVIDSSHKPAFVAGDFNGDLSEDVAVVLKPEAEKLSELNEEFSTWILRDLSGTKESGSPRLRIAADEVLLAVIHGFGPNGWRDPEATQTYLLKNAAGSSIAVQSAKDFLAANQGKRLPSLRGDVVALVRDGRSGYLYYGNSTYSWYDPKTFTGEPEPRRGHGAREQGMKK
jgi:hypothetical protein